MITPKDLIREITLESAYKSEYKFKRVEVTIVKHS